MITNANVMICGSKEARKIEIRPGQVATWTLIFTNAFFISYFFAKLIQLV